MLKQLLDSIKFVLGITLAAFIMISVISYPFVVIGIFIGLFHLIFSNELVGVAIGGFIGMVALVFISKSVVGDVIFKPVNYLMDLSSRLMGDEW